MIGKTFIDAVFTNKYAEIKPLEPIYEVNDDEINNLKKDIKDCDTTVEIDTAIKEAGLQNVANLSAHIKELRESGQIDTLDKGYVNDLIKTQNYTNIAERAHGFTGVSAAIKQYNGEIRNNAENTAKFADIMGKNNSKFASYIKNLNGAKASIPGYSVSLIGAKIKTLASNTTTMAVNMAMSTIAGAFMSWGIGQVISLLNQSEEAIQKAAESASELSSNLQSLDDYKTKITELKTALDSNTLSYTEAQAKRQELMRIQDEIIDKYGNEASGIDLVTGSIEKQGKAIDDLKAKDVEDWIAQNETAIYEAKKNMERRQTISISNLVGFGNFAEYGLGIFGDDGLANNLEERMKQIGGELDSIDYGKYLNSIPILSLFIEPEDLYFSFNVENYNEAINKFKQIIFFLEKYQEEIRTKFGMDSPEYANATDWLQNASDEYKEFIEDNSESFTVYEQYTNSILITNKKYRDILAEVTQAQKEYKNALINNLPENEINTYAAKLANIYNNIDLNSIKDMGVREKFEKIINTADDIIAEHIFSINLTLNNGELKSKLDNIVENFGGIDNISMEDILNFDPYNSMEINKILSYTILESYAETLNTPMEKLIANMEKSGIINKKTFNSLANDSHLSNYKEQLKTLTEEQLEFLAAQKKSSGEWKPGWIEAMNDFQILLKKIKSEMMGIFTDFEAFDGTAIGERLSYISNKFENGEIAYGNYFDFLNHEIENVDFSKFVDEQYKAAASSQFFLDSIKKTSEGLSELLSDFDNKKISVSEYLDGYTSIGETMISLTEMLEENKNAWDKNDKAIENGVGNVLENGETLNDLQSSLTENINTITELKGSCYSLTQIISGEVKQGTDEFQTHIDVISADLARIVSESGVMADEVKEKLGTTTSEIASNLTKSASNQSLAAQVIAANTNTAIGNMAESVGKLFNALGEAIKNFKVDLTFGIKKIDWSDANILGTTVKLPNIQFSLEASGKSLDTIGNAVSNFGNELKNNINSNFLTLDDFKVKPTNNYVSPKNITGNRNNETNHKDLKDTADKKGSGGGSKKEHETNDEYYNYYQARADDLKNGAEELEKEIEEIGAKIESAYKKGDTILAESLKKDLSDKQREYKDYLAKNAKAMRDMANSEILPIVYKIAPEFAGKTIDEFTDTEKLKVKERLDNEILARKNKIIDLENAGKSSDGSAKVSDSEVKSAERQLKILEELYTTLENIYDLAGNSAGQGEWAKKFRETIDNEIDKIKDDLDKNIDEREFKLSLFEDMGNDGGQLSVYRKMLQDYHSAAEEYRAMGVEEDSEAIKETQKGYRDAAKNIFELLNDTFDKFMDKRDDLSDNIEFKIDNLGDKEYGRHISLLEDEIALRKDNIAYIVKERDRLLEAYKNSTIAADEYEKRLRSLNDLEKEQVKSLKEYYETKRDIIMSQIDGQIDNITEATEKQTKAIDKQIDSLEKENDELNKLKDLYDKAYKAVQKIVDDETDALDKLKEQEEEYWNAKLDALEKMNEETKRGIELTEKKQAVEKAGQKTALVYHEDKGWTYEANPNELSEAQRDLDQWLIDDQFNQAKKSIEEQKEAVLKSIDEQIEGWNNYLELWGDAADAFEEEANDAAAKAVIGLNYSSQVLAQNTGIVSKYEKEYTDILRKIGDETSGGIAKQINDLEKQREAIEENSDAVTEALENEKKVWEELFSQGMIENVDAFVSHLEEKLNLVIGSVQGARELIQAFSNDMRDFVPHASELIPYNDEDIITIKQMYQNSGQWAKSNSQKSKDQLFARNEELSKQLSFSVRFDSHTGAWLDDNGNNIYGRLSENNNTAQRNTEAETENTYTIEGNTKASENNTKFLKSSVSQNKKLTSVIEKTTDTIEDLTDSVDSLSKNSGSLDRENNTENSNGNNSQTGSSLPSSSTGSPYTYSAELGGADIDTAKKWFSDKHKTYPGSKITVVGGGVSSLSFELISELGLKSGDLAVVGKRLYYITSNGYNKITDSLVNKYAKGCEYIPYSQTAVVDEEGDGSELLVHKDTKGRPKYLERGSEVVSAGHTRSLTSLLEDIGDSNVINALRDISGQYNPIKRIADSFTKAPDYIMGNNQNTSTVNNNYIDKVVLEQVNNVDDMFRGLTNMAMQRAHKRV